MSAAIPQIDATALAKARGVDASIALLDIREPWEFTLARIEGSTNIPMSTLTARVDEVQALQGTADLVLICHHGIRSNYCAQFLAQRGFSDLINLRGGIDAWSQLVDPEVPRY
jgi:rhodanese-related sulfurtransferase